MRLLCLLVFSCFCLRALPQDTAPLIRFTDPKTRLSGYKDLQGNVKFPAVFESFTKADTFKNIIGVYGKHEGGYSAYFLLKDGKKIGQDSLDVYNYHCEAEGKIQYTNRKNGRTGFFNTKGEVIIPAVLNEASDFHNGMSVVLRNAVRKCYDELGVDTLDCERLGWYGGERVLINERNETLVNNWTIGEGKIDWYSLRINDPSIDTGIYVSVKGANGKLYSFINYEKEFTRWFSKEFLPSLGTGAISSAYLMHHVNTWSENTGWITVTREDFIKRCEPGFTGNLFRENQFTKMVFDKNLAEPFQIDLSPFTKYLTACGVWDKEKFPLFIIAMKTYKKNTKGELSELVATRHYEFFRTEEGYKIISAPLRSKK